MAEPSQLSLASLRESASRLPQRKVFHWVAQWFTVSQLVTKILSGSLSTTSAILILTWESEGITAQNLDTNTFQFRGRVNAYMAVGFLTLVYAVVMVTIGLVGVKVNAKVLACVAGVVLLLWFLSSPIMSATVTELADSRFARWRDISVVQLEAATGLGFLCLMISIVDILLSFQQLTEIDNDSARFAVEVETSRSAIRAVKSGDTIPLSVTGTVRQRSSRTTASLRYSRQSHDVILPTEEEGETLFVTDDMPTLGIDDDSTWEAIGHEVVPLTTSS